MNDFISEDDPVLRQIAAKVEFPLSEEEKTLIQEMREFLINSQTPEIAEKYGLRPGVGVAAPQLGISKQIFAIYLTEIDEDGEVSDVLVDEIVINPRIIKHSVKKAALKDGEGCLSVPRDVPGLVPRPRRITLEYQDQTGETIQVKLKDYSAIVFQHEIDHLKGILFYDHIQEHDPFRADEDTTLL